MSKSEREAILEDALRCWGEAAQTDMCIEEMSELTKALLKVRRLHASELGGEEHAKRVEAVREEIADVKIMLDQMQILYGDPAEIEKSKLDRLKTRLQKARASFQYVRNVNVGEMRVVGASGKLGEDIQPNVGDFRQKRFFGETGGNG